MTVMTSDPTGTPRFDLDSGGRICLDFANTVSGDRHGSPRERLPGYPELVAWARQAGVVDAAHARQLLAEARRRPADAEAVHREALALREALFRVFSAAAERRGPAPEDVGLVSAHLGRALSHRRLERADEGFALGWERPPAALDAPLWEVAAQAAELLASPRELERVRVCGMHETHECSWLFMDATRAGTRRWCSMSSCGNRAKARRHYARAKEE